MEKLNTMRREAIERSISALRARISTLQKALECQPHPIRKILLEGIAADEDAIAVLNNMLSEQ